MSEFSTTGTVTLEMDEDDPFDWVGESDDEEGHFPHPKEQVKEHYESKPFVRSIAEATTGLIIKVPSGDRHEAFGGMVRERGWIVDYIDWEDGIVQIAPLPEEVLQR